MAMAEDSVVFYSSSISRNGSICEPLLGPLADTSSNLQYLVSSIHTSTLPLVVTSDAEPPMTPVLSASSPPLSTGSRDLILHWKVTPPPLPTPPMKRDAAAELRDIVDDMLRKKRNAQQTLADENATLRAQVSFLRAALAHASSAPGSETADFIAALDLERTLRVNAEESRAATGKYLAEQVESVSKQKLDLERALRDFTHGREWWKAKAIAALERCEALEAENLMVKAQLSTLARRQSTVVTDQVSSALREVAEERDRLQQLEETGLPLGKTSTPVHARQRVDSKSKYLSPKGVQTYRMAVR